MATPVRSTAARQGAPAPAVATPAVAAPTTARSTRTTLLWWALAVAALLVGYVDLVRGGITLSAVLLVLGYCVLVPVAILRR